MQNDDEAIDKIKNLEAFRVFAETGDPRTLVDVVTAITGAEVDRVDVELPNISYETKRAKRALAALRFIMIPELSEDLKEFAYQQVLLVLEKMMAFENKSGYVTSTGQVLRNVHPKSQCEGEYCVIHNPSLHHMVDWPMHIRSDPFAHPLIERFCSHGTGHPDPDSAAYLNRRDETDTWDVHGCDGCCATDH